MEEDSDTKTDFMAQVALESLKGEKSVTEIASQFDIDPRQVIEWKSLLQERAAILFENTELHDCPYRERVENDTETVLEILSRTGITNDEVNRLLNIFYDYVCGNEPRPGRNNIPPDLMAYVAREIKRYADNRKYRPFPGSTGRPSTIKWHLVREKVLVHLELGDLSDKDASSQGGGLPLTAFRVSPTINA